MELRYGNQGISMIAMAAKVSYPPGCYGNQEDMITQNSNKVLPCFPIDQNFLRQISIQNTKDSPKHTILSSNSYSTYCLNTSSRRTFKFTNTKLPV